MRVLFRDPERRAFRTAVAHVGLVLAPGLLIHVERGGDGAVMARYRGHDRDRALAGRVAGFRRHPRLAPPSRHAGG
jgi:hypothetical protein